MKTFMNATITLHVKFIQSLTLALDQQKAETHLRSYTIKYPAIFAKTFKRQIRTKRFRTDGRKDSAVVDTLNRKLKGESVPNSKTEGYSKTNVRRPWVNRRMNNVETPYLKLKDRPRHRNFRTIKRVNALENRKWKRPPDLKIIIF